MRVQKQAILQPSVLLFAEIPTADASVGANKDALAEQLLAVGGDAKPITNTGETPAKSQYIAAMDSWPYCWQLLSDA